MLKMLPNFFFGHSNLLNVMQQNGFTERWSRIGQEIARIKAILAFSAHSLVSRTGVTVSTSARTIHDLGRLPRVLYEVQYPASVDLVLGQRIQQLRAPMAIKLDTFWGLNHGQSSRTSTLLRIFRQDNWAATKRRILYSVTIWEESFPRCSTKVFGSSVAAYQPHPAYIRLQTTHARSM